MSITPMGVCCPHPSEGWVNIVKKGLTHLKEKKILNIELFILQEFMTGNVVVKKTARWSDMPSFT